jgi:hypothetical protein
MKTTESMVWVALFWALYAPTDEVTKLEVYENDKTEKQEARPSAFAEGGFEQGVPMRTDVDLCRLDVDDDSDVSDGSSGAAD